MNQNMFTFKKQENAQFWATSILITEKKMFQQMFKNCGVSSSRHFFYNDKEQQKNCVFVGFGVSCNSNQSLHCVITMIYYKAVFHCQN